MPSSYSASLRFELQFTGENINAWGEKLNSAISRIDSSIAGFATVTLSGNTYSLTANNGSADEARSASIRFNGSPTETVTVTIPAVSKLYLFWNDCGEIVTISTGSGTTCNVEDDDIVWVMCDGNNVKPLGFNSQALKDFIQSSVVSTGALPSQVGNTGKFLKTVSEVASWQFVNATDLADYPSAIKGMQVALAVTL